jgi:hypothetical protein
LTLVALFAISTGAWAISDPNSVYWDNTTWAGWAENVTTHTVGDITITCSGNAKAYESTTSGEPLAMEAGNNDAITFTSNGAPFASISISTDDQLNVAGWTYNSSTWSYEWSGEPTTSVSLSGCDIKADAITFTFGTAEAPITVEWNASTKTGTFQMPGSDVVLTPQYAPTAKWDVVETVPQQPAALEGIIAGQDAAIVTAGQSAQGTVMYAVTTTAETAPALTAFSATVPTAKTYDDATTLYVWYYIQGHDTPDGQQATEENTFNDSEISATPLKVDILTNKFDLTLSPAPVKNMTVTVAGQAKTPTDEGKVEAVKMQSEVKLKAATGYKFRKVEVKKGGAATLATALENGATVVIAFNYRDDDGTCTFTNNNGTFTFVSGTGQLGGGNGPKQLSVENGKLIFKGSITNSFTDRWSWYGFQVTFDPTANTYEVWKGSDLNVASFTSISVNGTDITDQLSELK